MVLFLLRSINVYKAVVLTTLLLSHLHLIERYHQRTILIDLNIQWSDFVTNIDVLEMANVTSIEAMLLETQFRWAGHVSPGWIAYQRSYYNIYGELSTGHRDKGTPQKYTKSL